MYKYYIHDMMNCYVSDDFQTAYDIALDMAYNYGDNNFICLYDRERKICYHHIDELTAAYENMQI